MTATQPLSALTAPAPVPKSRMALLAGLIVALVLVGISGGGYWFWHSRTGGAAPPGASDSETKTAPASLIKAIEMGQMEEAQRLLAAGVNINQADDKGTTALMQAAEGSAYLPNNTLAVTMLLDILLNNGASVDLQDKSGRTALSRAVAEGEDEAVRQLLAKKADPNHKDSSGSPILLEAVQYGRLAMAPVLIESGAQVELPDAHGTTPLLLVAEGTAYMPNNAPLVSALLEAGAKVETQDDRGRTPLYRAAAEGKEDALRLLFEKQADPNRRANDGSTALFESVTFGKTGAAKMLIEKRAGLDQPDANGDTALMVAAEGTAYVPNNGPWVEMLLAAGAKVDAQDQRGRTPLYRAAAEGKEDAERLLPGKKANPNQRANDGSSPLSQAVTFVPLDAAKLLLDRGAAADAADANGTTPLMIVAEGNPYIKAPEQFLALLLAHKVRTDLMDSRGRTALDLAAESKNAAAIEILKKGK